MGAVSSALESRQAAKSDVEKRVITVRLSKAMHARLIGVAHDQRTSLNVLCVSALEAALKELEVNR